MATPDGDTSSRIERIAVRSRDLSIAILGLLIVTGVVVRSFHAFNFGLGFFPGNNIQFVAAGIGPVLIGLIAGVAIYGAIRGLSKLKKWLADADWRPRWLFRKALPSQIERLELYVWVSVISYGVGFVVLWAIAIYPSVPQSFGGAAPRCAVLFAKTADVPSQLIPVVFNPSGSNTLATDEIDVYWESRNGYVIRVLAEGGYRGYEIAYNVVSAVRWC